MEKKLNKSILFAIVVLILAIIFFPKSSSQGSNYCMKKTYDFYKKNYMTIDGRIIDPQKDNITTSEGQSYMMLRSLLSDDKSTFDLSYRWAKNNLQRKDKLFGWLWGKNDKNEYKIIDDNSASDADVDIAFALILAYEKWGEKKYLQEAMPIIDSIWNNETRQFGEYLVLMPGYNQTAFKNDEINPSYFSPYAFKVFNKYDKTHNWNKLVDSSYYYLEQSTAATKTGLPPNWFLIKNDQIVLENSERSDFSYDAVRVFARVFLDYKMTGEKRALPILAKSNFFVDNWKKSKSFYTNYKYDGQLRDSYKFIGSISLLIPVISLNNPQIAAEIYNSEILPYFSDKKYWENKKDYYGLNLLWFGCYLYNSDSKEQ